MTEVKRWTEDSFKEWSLFCVLEAHRRWLMQRQWKKFLKLSRKKGPVHADRTFRVVAMTMMTYEDPSQIPGDTAQEKARALTQVHKHLWKTFYGE